MPMVLNGVFWCLAFVYWETVLHVTVYGDFSAKFAYVVGFSLSIGCIVSVLLSFLPKKAGFAVSVALSLVLAVLYGSQMVYNFIFGTMYSLVQVGMGGAALTSFWRETLMTMWEEILWLALLLVPTVAMALLRKWKPECFRDFRMGGRILLAVVAVVAHLGVLLALQLGGTGVFSDHYFYTNDAIATNQTAERFGLLTTFRLELGGGEEEAVEEEPSYYAPTVATEAPAPSGEAAEENAGETQPEEKLVEYNVLNIDFDALKAKTTNKRIQAINDYCAMLTGTNKNEYTGMLSDYNLIVLCGESFSTAAIHPEVTPTLYRLANEGFVFTNYYNTFPNTTTNGEYTLLQGLYPDSAKGKYDSSMFASLSRELPFAMGNQFNKYLGVPSRGYHNYLANYYGRQLTHPNMGYTMKFAGDGMEFSNAWPASDLEMMEQSVDDYIGQEQFHAYYMTFSGHYKYDTSTNLLAAQNWDVVKHLPYSDTAKAYLSCHVELDKAMEYLLKRLEEAGVADKTAIVLTGDHFPYGLKDEEFSELVGYEVDDFSKYKSSLIFWVGGMEEPEIVDEYCCNADILPTILNLWGMEYDSRMLAGTDVFSDSEHMAVLIDRSFLTDKVWLNANTGEIRLQVPEEEVPEGYVENMIRLVETRFSISADILNTGYYGFVFGE